jgi:hypothetical protein
MRNVVLLSFLLGACADGAGLPAQREDLWCDGALECIARREIAGDECSLIIKVGEGWEVKDTFPCPAEII